jgi:hypothetical protein
VLHDVLEPLERLRPQVREHATNRLERLRTKRIESLRSIASLGEQTGAFEHLQMLAHGLLRDGEVRRDLADGELVAPDELQHVAPMRVGESAKNRIGGLG